MTSLAVGEELWGRAPTHGARVTDVADSFKCGTKTRTTTTTTTPQPYSLSFSDLSTRRYLGIFHLPDGVSDSEDEESCTTRAAEMARRCARDAELRWRWHTRGERAMIAASERDVRAAAARDFGLEPRGVESGTGGYWRVWKLARELKAARADTVATVAAAQPEWVRQALRQAEAKKAKGRPLALLPRWECERIRCAAEASVFAMIVQDKEASA